MEHFIDAHCHYNAAAFAGYAGPGQFICNAVDVADWAVLTAVTNSWIHIALGVHPWHVNETATQWADELQRLLIKNPHAMVGEIGLDASRDDIAAQYDAFIVQYRIAAKLGRAVHIHCVRAWDKMLHALKTVDAPPIIVAHRFAGNAQILNAAMHISDNIYFSYRDADIDRMHDTVMATPLSRILVESDAAKPEEAGIMAAILKIAQIHGKSVTDVSDIIYNNSLRVINNGQIASDKNVIG